MMRSHCLAGLAAAALLAGCAVGPNYRPPSGWPAPGPFVSAAGPTFSDDAPADEWWRLYQDPVLDRLVAEALSQNRDLAAAQASLRQVRAVLSETRSAFLPSTTVTAQGVRSRQNIPNSGVQVEQDTLSLGFQAAYELDIFGRLRRTRQGIRADRDAAAAALEAAQVVVAAETARAYADACGANRSIEVATRSAALFGESAGLAARQLDAGRGTGLDVSRARAALEGARAAIPLLEAQRDAALFRLSVLIGRPPAAFPPEVRACARLPDVATPIPVGDGASLLKRRPDVRQAERRLAAATARVGVATADLFPTVTLGGSLTSVDNNFQTFSDPPQFSVGPLISWRFPNILAARARVRQAGAAADVALAGFEKANLVALQEAETALTAYAKDLDRRAALRRARDEGARAVRLARMRRDAGLDSYLSVLDAERTLAGLELEAARAEAQTSTDQIAVFKALGGGWPSRAVKR